MLNSARISPFRASAPADPAAHQRRVDRVLAAVRAEPPASRPTIFRPPPPRPAPSDDPLDHRIVEELDCIRRHLELLGGVLANNPLLLHRHDRELQSIDRIDQLLVHLGRVIAAGDKEMAIQQVSMPDLRARLQREPIRPIAD